MSNPMQVNGMDIPIAALKPLRERAISKIKTHKGFIRIRSQHSGHRTH